MKNLLFSARRYFLSAVIFALAFIIMSVTVSEPSRFFVFYKYFSARQKEMPKAKRTNENSTARHGKFVFLLTFPFFSGIMSVGDGKTAARHVAERYWCEESPGFTGQDNG